MKYYQNYKVGKLWHSVGVIEPFRHNCNCSENILLRLGANLGSIEYRWVYDRIHRPKIYSDLS